MALHPKPPAINLPFSSSPPPWLVENAAVLSGTFDDFATPLRSENGIQITAKEFNNVSIRSAK